MKKPVIAFASLLLTAASAAAAGNLNTVPGDPKKDKSSNTMASKPETSFSFSSGYFSFFNLFVSEATVPDTLRMTALKTSMPGKTAASKQNEE